MKVVFYKMTPVHENAIIINKYITKFNFLKDFIDEVSQYRTINETYRQQNKISYFVMLVVC